MKRMAKLTVETPSQPVAHVEPPDVFVLGVVEPDAKELPKVVRPRVVLLEGSRDERRSVTLRVDALLRLRRTVPGEGREGRRVGRQVRRGRPMPVPVPIPIPIPTPARPPLTHVVRCRPILPRRRLLQLAEHERLERVIGPVLFLVDRKPVLEAPLEDVSEELARVLRCRAPRLGFDGEDAVIHREGDLEGAVREDDVMDDAKSAVGCWSGGAQGRGEGDEGPENLRRGWECRFCCPRESTERGTRVLGGGVAYISVAE